MKKIKWLAAGGTISCVPSEKGLVPAAEELLQKQLAQICTNNTEISAECIMDIDSTNILCRDIRNIGEAVNKAIVNGFDGVVITHGTDTMAYTSALLHRIIKDPHIPVIITGSQKPFFEYGSDGKANLQNAFAAAQISELKGVYILFGDKIISGNMAHKQYSLSENAFVSCGEYAAFISDGKISISELPEHCGQYSYNPDFNENVRLIKITPCTSPDVIDDAVQRGIKGLVLEGYGLGGIPERLLSSVGEAIRSGVKIMLISQCFYEGVDMSVYGVGTEAFETGVISGGKMCAESALAEMMFLTLEK